ncbi:MAG: hypothetical protein P1V97_27960 [Planctomycetota bacterium]|nr:hypothetical protein [Planctomycetota bacterium]
MISKKTIGFLSLALALSFPVSAQDFNRSGGDKPDLGGDPSKKLTETPATPAQPGEVPGATPENGPTKAQLTEEEQEARNAKIKAELDEAERIAKRTLKDKSSDYKTTSKRVQNLQRLVKEYEAREGQALRRKRAIQMEIFNRSLYLEKQKNAGKIPTAVYNRRVVEENKKYERERRELNAEVSYCQKELAVLRKRLGEQEADKRVQEATNPRLLRANRKKVAKAPTLPGFIDKKIRALSAFKIKGSLGNERLDGHP